MNIFRDFAKGSLLFGFGVILAGGCSKTAPKAADKKGDTPAKKEGKEAKPEAADKADKADRGGQAGDAPAAKAEAGSGQAAGDKKGADKGAPTGRSFSKGDRAISGVTASEIPFYNRAQGDPIEGEFTLAMALAGDPNLEDKSKGTLTATFKTTAGDFECKLHEDKAPKTVANFVGLARGLRPFLDPKTEKWGKAPFYNDVLFHRVIKGFMIQTGDRTGTGTKGTGYFVADEFHPKLRHTGPGLLSMANRNRVNPATGKHFKHEKTGEAMANTGSSQFFVTVAPTPHLDDRHSIFGKCDPKVPIKISKVPVKTQPPYIDHRPVEKVKINTIEISRKK